MVGDLRGIDNNSNNMNNYRYQTLQVRCNEIQLFYSLI
jgi:hypothetical protein